MPRHNRALKIQYYQAIRPLACMVLKVFETSAEPVSLCPYCETELLLERFLQFQNLKMLLVDFLCIFDKTYGIFFACCRPDYNKVELVRCIIFTQSSQSHKI